jgi:2-haloacid dehalogenase
MLENAKPHIGFEFDQVISVQEAGAFKPDWRTYAAAEEILTAAYPSVERSGIMHVANHAFDCIGAKAYGFRAAFIDRRNRPYGGSPHQPDLCVADFTELADALL